jgi:hypothetical protein
MFSCPTTRLGARLTTFGSCGPQAISRRADLHFLAGILTTRPSSRITCAKTCRRWIRLRSCAGRSNDDTMKCIFKRFSCKHVYGLMTTNYLSQINSSQVTGLAIHANNAPFTFACLYLDSLIVTVPGQPDRTHACRQRFFNAVDWLQIYPFTCDATRMHSSSPYKSSGLSELGGILPRPSPLFFR